ncbi:30S ribosomal protein THX [Galbibacter sp. BG1]|nr:30S ribosomal protein THX [Galbibacter sp. BG1]QLE01658.1 30S ribosomal protein THX [Galbibacter sp. BG1]
MGKGDKKTKRGKISRGSYGVRRRKKIKKRTPVEEKVSVDTKK